MKFYSALLSILLIVAANNYTRLAIATMHEEVRARVLLFREYCKNHAEKLEPRVELCPEEGSASKL